MEQINIEKCTNGFLVKWYEDDFTDAANMTVFESPDRDKYGDLEACANMLWFIVENFGLLGSKHDKKRINICVEGQQ